MADPTPTAVDERAEPMPAQAEDDLLVVDVLVEEVSIDGMCGVY